MHIFHVLDFILITVSIVLSVTAFIKTEKNKAQILANLRTKSDFLQLIGEKPEPVNESDIETVTRTECVEAWRTWAFFISHTSKEVFLQSCYMPAWIVVSGLHEKVYGWPHGQVLGIHKNTAIELNNKVGIHAWKTLELAQNYNNVMGDENYWVVGKVYLGGEIIQQSLGYRATQAYPATLYINPENQVLGQKLAASYGCEIIYDKTTKIIPEALYS